MTTIASKPGSSKKRNRRNAMILSGGGARGAYEVGVLWYIFDDLSRMRGAPPKVDILCGTSVGAINACYLAAHLSDPVLGMRRLVHLWSELQITRVLGFGAKPAISIERETCRISAGSSGSGWGIGCRSVPIGETVPAM